MGFLAATANSYSLVTGFIKSINLIYIYLHTPDLFTCTIILNGRDILIDVLIVIT